MSMKKNANRILKRALLTLLCAVLAAGLVPVPARAATFTDIPEWHWAYHYVERAYAEGAVYGVGDGRYDPDSTVTAAEFAAMLTRAFLPEAVAAQPEGEYWYSRYWEVAMQKGINGGISAMRPQQPLPRENMARALYALMDALDAPCLRMTESIQAVQAQIPDIESCYDKRAVAQVYYAGLLTGVDEQGTFAPQRTMTRAEVAVVYCRVSDAMPWWRTFHDTMSSIVVDGQTYTIGMGEADLLARAGMPDDILPAFAGYYWYVFGTSDYARRFFVAGVEEGKVVTLIGSGPSFSYRGVTVYDVEASVLDALSYRTSELTGSGIRNLYFDKNDNQYLHLVFLADTYHRYTSIWNPDAAQSESKLCFYLTNAFRSRYGLRAFLWSEPTAEASRQHAANMLTNDFFAHNDPQGRTPTDRVAAQVGYLTGANENISLSIGQAQSGLDSHVGWVSSSAHRNNLLHASNVYMGTGCAMGGGKCYTVENFYR